MKFGIFISPATINPPIIHSIYLVVLWPDYMLLERLVLSLVVNNRCCCLQELDDAQVQEKIAYEYRMRDGAMKLLAACSDEPQTYEAAKNLHTINARILALMSLLQQYRAKSVIRRRQDSRLVSVIINHQSSFDPVLSP